jgi:DNA primase
MAVWQAGYQEVVALVGSYLTELQAELLARFTNNVIVFLDNNEAGIVGTRKAIKTLFKSGVEPRIARYPDEREQPDALIDLEIQEALQETLTAREWSSRHEQLYQDARYTHG